MDDNTVVLHEVIYALDRVLAQALREKEKTDSSVILGVLAENQPFLTAVYEVLNKYGIASPPLLERMERMNQESESAVKRSVQRSLYQPSGGELSIRHGALLAGVMLANHEVEEEAKPWRAAKGAVPGVVLEVFDRVQARLGGRIVELQRVEGALLVAKRFLASVLPEKETGSGN